MLSELNPVEHFFVLKTLLKMRFIIFIHHQISLAKSSEGECGGQDMWHIWERREVYKVLVGNSEEESPLGRPRRSWEDGIRMGLGETD
jgi:hypothetical protein